MRRRAGPWFEANFRRRRGRFRTPQAAWRGRVYDMLARSPFLSAKDVVYNDWYYQSGDAQKREMYHRLGDALYAELGPSSAVDIGCGTGIILALLEERGVACRGVEGSRPAIAQSPLGDRIMRWDLARGVPALGRFDVCICIEVAEHLPPRSGPTLIDGLTGLSDVVVFSAAVPGQTGTGHLNERPHAYWRDLFEARGFTESDLTGTLRAVIADIPQPWYMHVNLLVFERTPSPPEAATGSGVAGN